ASARNARCKKFLVFLSISLSVAVSADFVTAVIPIFLAGLYGEGIFGRSVRGTVSEKSFSNVFAFASRSVSVPRSNRFSMVATRELWSYFVGSTVPAFTYGEMTTAGTR